MQKKKKEKENEDSIAGSWGRFGIPENYTLTMLRKKILRERRYLNRFSGIRNHVKGLETEDLD